MHRLSNARRFQFDIVSKQALCVYVDTLYNGGRVCIRTHTPKALPCMTQDHDTYIYVSNDTRRQIMHIV